MITYRDEVPELGPDDADGFFEGWPIKPSAERFASVLSASYRRVLAYDDDRLVGFITAIGDGMNAHIPLLEVRPSHRGQGIGSELVVRLLGELDDLYAIDVVCDEDLMPFYERFGLRPITALAMRNPGSLGT